MVPAWRIDASSFPARTDNPRVARDRGGMTANFSARCSTFLGRRANPLRPSTLDPLLSAFRLKGEKHVEAEGSTLVTLQVSFRDCYKETLLPDQRLAGGYTRRTSSFLAC